MSQKIIKLTESDIKEIVKKIIIKENRYLGSCVEVGDDNSCKKELSDGEELVNDLMMLMTSFTGRVHSKRAQENRKKQK